MSTPETRYDMDSSVALGFNGLSIPPGTHICAFFRGTHERDQIMVPFLVEGLRAGQKCLCIIDDGVDDARSALAKSDVLDNDERHRLEIRSSAETYLRHGEFSTREMLDFWDDSVGAAVRDEGFPFVRSAGETTWTLKELPSLYDFLTYEAELNRFLPRYPQVIMCLYDLHRFGGEILVDILNVAKHAHADVIDVHVAASDGVLRVAVRDNGRGGADPARGSGLIGLTDRVEALGGRIALHGPHGAGTSLEFALPLDSSGPA